MGDSASCRVKSKFPRAAQVSIEDCSAPAGSDVNRVPRTFTTARRQYGGTPRRSPPVSLEKYARWLRQGPLRFRQPGWHQGRSPLSPSRIFREWSQINQPSSAHSSLPSPVPTRRSGNVQQRKFRLMRHLRRSSDKAALEHRMAQLLRILEARSYDCGNPAAPGFRDRMRMRQ